MGDLHLIRHFFINCQFLCTAKAKSVTAAGETVSYQSTGVGKATYHYHPRYVLTVILSCSAYSKVHFS